MKGWARQCRGVFFAAQFFDFVENRAEHICFVIRNCAIEIGEVFCPLNHSRRPFETHSRVDVALRQRSKGAIRVRIELDEHQIPDFDAPSITLIHQLTPGATVRGQIDVNLRTRPAGTGVAHHPEVVGFVAVDDVNFRIEIRLPKQTSPMIVRFLIELARFVRPWAVNCRVEPRRRKFPTLD